MIDRASSRARAAALLSRLTASTRRFIRQARAELACLNRAGLHPDALAGQPRRTRARIVRAALARRHDGRHRCC